MRLIAIIIIALVQTPTLYGQSSDALSAITTVRQAKKFVKSNSRASISTIKLFQDTSYVAKRLLENSAGFVCQFEDTVYKTVDVKKYPLYRASYVFLDGNKLPKNKIDNIREDVVTKYKSGIAFNELAKTYSMDAGKDRADLGWFGEGVMAKGFESEVRDHKRGEIFNVDITDQNWFFVVLKTHDNLEMKEMIILKLALTK